MTVTLYNTVAPIIVFQSVPDVFPRQSGTEHDDDSELVKPCVRAHALYSCNIILYYHARCTPTVSMIFVILLSSSYNTRVRTADDSVYTEITEI